MKYWVYLNGEVPGSYTPEELAAMPGVGETTMVCPADGGIEERNWLRAGQFPELLDAIGKLERPPLAPGAPVPTRAVDTSRPLDPNDILNDSSSRLFRHVSDLMKEMENRRAERAMTQSLQRQVVELKNELLALRERNQYLQDRADLIPGFQEREDRLQKDFDATRGRLQEREAALRNAESDVAKTKDALEKSKRGETSLSEELKRQAQVMEDLSKQLAQKEFTLAKAFGVIRRLEEVLGDLLPGSVAGIASEVPGYKDETPPPPPPPPSSEARPQEEPERPPEPEIQVRRREPEVPEETRPPEIPVKTREPETPKPSQEPGPQTDPVQPEPVSEAADSKETVGEVLPAPSEKADPALEELVSSSYTADTGEPAKRVDLPPEGEVTPVPPPWTKLVERFTGFMKKSFAQEPAPPPASDPVPPPPPAPSASEEGPSSTGDKTPDQN